MKIFKRGLVTVAFFLGLAALLYGLSFLFYPDFEEACFLEKEIDDNGILGEGKNTIDILIAGDSESYSAFSPMQLWREKGYTSYHLGTTGQTLDISHARIQQSFLRQNPKVVVLETDAIYREIPKDGLLITGLEPVFSIFRYHDRWKHLPRLFKEGKDEIYWVDYFKGYSHSNVIDPCENKAYMLETDEVEEVEPLNKWYLKKIQKLCHKNGAELILVSSPSPVNWNTKRHNGIEKVAKELECAYVDMNLENEKIKIDWEHDTRDKGDHLNCYGTIKATTYLGEYLEATGLLIRHQDDEVARKWNEALSIYEYDLGI